METQRIDQLTHHDRDALIKGGIMIEQGKATLAAEWLADRFTALTNDRAHLLARARTFALWLTLMAGWLLPAPTGIAIRQLLNL